jgi:hypothetical protein
MIVFFGAEFTKQRAVYHGKEIVASNAAEKIKIDYDVADSENFSRENAGKSQ